MPWKRPRAKSFKSLYKCKYVPGERLHPQPAADTAKQVRAIIFTWELHGQQSLGQAIFFKRSVGENKAEHWGASIVCECVWMCVDVCACTWCLAAESTLRCTVTYCSHISRCIGVMDKLRARSLCMRWGFRWERRSGRRIRGQAVKHSGGVWKKARDSSIMYTNTLTSLHKIYKK